MSLHLQSVRKMNKIESFMTSPSIHNQCPSPVNVQQALLYPIPEKCGALSALLRDLPIKELQGIFSLVVEHIFGFRSHTGWKLKSTYRRFQPQEFDAIRSFLAPDGPLLHAAYKLLSDAHARFEFPTTCLPVSTQSQFEEGTVSPLYNNKVPYHGPGRSITHVLLNAFEYFLFHFAYVIVNPNQQKTISQPYNGMDVLYSCLLEDYLRYFLPVDGRNVPAVPFNIFGHASLQPIPISNYTSISNLNQSPTYGYLNTMYPSPISPSHASSTPRPHPSLSPTLLKKTPALLKTMPNVSLSPISSSTTVSSGMADHTHLEIWRTELLTMVLVEFWLNFGSNETRKTSFGVGSPDTFAPSHEHMKVVRILVKHMHYFRNSSKPAIKPSWNLPAQHMPLDEFKNSMISHLVQKKLYSFLRFSFERWPLDATFRLPLETWLSYIQPWRYVTYGERQSLTQEREESEKEFDPTWQKFVTENLLFYTVIFQQLLPRFFRMDLTSPKNSYMLFRVTKVFAQQHLNTMIEEAERTLQGPAQSWLGTSASVSSNLTPSCPAHTPSAAGTLRQHVADLEVPGFVYTPLFSNAVREKASELLRIVGDASDVVENILKEQESKRRGWFRETIASIFLSDVFYPPDDYTADDCNKVILHLQYSSSQLCYLLGMSQEQRIKHTPSRSSTHDTGPDRGLDRGGPHLTPLGRQQLLRKICKADVEYRGNPDTQPIRSYEVAFLVRMLYHYSSYLNEKYGLEIANLYSRRNWLGRLCRQVLAPPAICSRLVKDGTMTSFVFHEEALPARIDLRILAHKQVLGYVLLLGMIAYAFGYGPFMYLLFLAVVFFLFVTVRATLANDT